MAFIPYTAKDQIPLDDRVADDDNIIQIHAIHSRIMRLHYDLYIETMHRPSPLSRQQREMIAVVVSSMNGCEYWRVHHARGLRRLLLSNAKKTAATLNEGVPDEKQIDGLIAQLEEDYRQAELNEADRQMLDYSSKLTAQPQAIEAADVQKLRDVGFDDLAIHDIVCCVSYFAFVNRIADGLGVELESPT